MWLLTFNVPKDANCLCKAKRDWTRPLSSFMVLSIWLALRELPTCTPWKHKSVIRLSHAEAELIEIKQP